MTIIRVFVLLAGFGVLGAQGPGQAGKTAGSVDSLFQVEVTSGLGYPVTSGASKAEGQLDLYEPVGPGAPRVRPAFVAIHGGGLETGDKATENIVELCRVLASHGYVCAAINYRLRKMADGALQPSPARALQDAVEDAGRALDWITSQSSAWRVDPSRIVVGGSSAGATIALRLAYGGTPSAKKIAGVFSWSGSLYASPDLLSATGPPLFIVHGTADTLVPVEEARTLAKRARSVSLRHAVYICEGIEHHMPLDRRPLGRSIYEHLVAFLASASSPGARTDPASIPCPR